MAEAPESPSVVLGAGYAGLATWRAAAKLARGRWPVLLVDRHPSHVLRTELYKVGQLAGPESERHAWAVPLAEALDGESGSIRTGTVERIDLAHRTVTVGGSPLEFRELAICLGSVPAFFGVSGAAEHAFHVYRLAEAQRLAGAILERLGRLTPAPLQVSVVGGGTTGTEVAAEIATTDWSRVLGRPVPAPNVTLVVGALPFLAGLPESVVGHARSTLARARVRLDEGRNVREVTPDHLVLTEGTDLPHDLCVWAAGVQPPEVVRQIDAEHARSGRLVVDENLEVPGHPGAFALGDVAQFVDPRTKAPVPATAQAALAEAPIAGANLAARRLGRPLRPFVYREKGVIVALGVRGGAGRVEGLTVWGRPARLIKRGVERYERLRAEHGPPGG